MALLLETTIGDLVIDLDIDGSPALCKNVLKLAKARYYTGNLVYNVQPNRFCQMGDPCGDGSGGACIYGLLDAYEESRKRKDPTKPNVMASQRRFLKSDMGRPLTQDECMQRGRVIATEMNGIADTIGSQLLITIDEGPDRALHNFRSNGMSNNDGVKSVTTTSDGLAPQKFRSVGTVVEDDSGVLEKLNTVYCDSNGRPYADVRVIRALVIEDPFDDPEGMDQLLEDRGVALTPVGDGDADDRNSRYRVSDSPDYERPPEEKVETRISADDIDEENAGDGDMKKMRLQEEERLKREDKSRAVVLEMLGDLPSANITAPENVLFVCKLNSVTEDEDLELIFSRFDEKVTAEIVRDHKTGASLQYAFVEFTTKDQAAEAYFKMNNALVDDRRIKVDFSQSVSKVWDRFNQRDRKQSSSNHAMPKDPFKEQQQQMPHRKKYHQDRERHIDTRSDRRGNNNGRNSNNPHHHKDHRYYDTKSQRHDYSRRNHEGYRAANDNKKNYGRNSERAVSTNHYDDHHSHSSVEHRNHSDRSARDRHSYRSNHEKRHHEGRDRHNSHFRSRNNEDKYSRSREHRTDRRRDESSTRRSSKKPRYDSDMEDFSGSDKSETSPSTRSRRKSDDRHRRSSSRSRSDSESYGERERHRSGHKKSKKKRHRRREDDRHHHKRSRRDSKHHHREKDRKEARGRERHR